MVENLVYYIVHENMMHTCTTSHVHLYCCTMCFVLKHCSHSSMILRIDSALFIV